MAWNKQASQSGSIAYDQAIITKFRFLVDSDCFKTNWWAINKAIQSKLYPYVLNNWGVGSRLPLFFERIPHKADRPVRIWSESGQDMVRICSNSGHKVVIIVILDLLWSKQEVLYLYMLNNSGRNLSGARRNGVPSGPGFVKGPYFLRRYLYPKGGGGQACLWGTACPFGKRSCLRQAPWTPSKFQQIQKEYPMNKLIITSI